MRCMRLFCSASRQSIRRLEHCSINRYLSAPQITWRWSWTDLRVRWLSFEGGEHGEIWHQHYIRTCTACVLFKLYCGRQGSRVNYHIYSECIVDNFFSSDALAEKLLQERLTFVGTVWLNKPYLLLVITSNGNTPVISSIFLHQEHLKLLWYSQKKGKRCFDIQPAYWPRSTHRSSR